MIDNLINFALGRRVMSAVTALAIAGIGVWSMLTISLDSFPDVSNVQVQIITEPESMATEEVETLITYPIETALNGLPKVKKIRSLSAFGLSVVTAIFEDDTDVYFARQLVQQRLLQTQSSLPVGCPTPALGPVISSFSQVFMYCLESTSTSETELRTLQDWEVARRIRSVPGVAGVATYGGFVKQYQVQVNPDTLRSFNVHINDVMLALSENNSNAGGNFIEEAGEEVIIRGIGRFKSVDDIEDVVLKTVDGTPIKIGQIADVVEGKAFRRGSASRNGQGETVTGIVMTRKGANTKSTVEHVKERIAEIQQDLPSGVHIEPYYDQTELVDKTIDTVKEILLFSGGLVIVVLTAVLLHIPSALIVAVIIPLSLLFSFILMKYSGLSANLMTLGAVDFGIVVDAGVVMVENIFRHLAHKNPKPGKEALEVIREAALEVGKPIVFAIAIIISVYIPLFTLEGVEGKMFQPLALTFIYALLGSLLVSLTVIPLFCYWFMKMPIVERENPALHFVFKGYSPALKAAMMHPARTMTISLIALAMSILMLPFLGSEFIPSLDEGPILLRTKMPASIAHSESEKLALTLERILLDFAEVETVVARTGRSNTGPGLDGVESTDFFIGLKPHSKWKNYHNKEALIDAMAAKVKGIPGVMYSFSQPIADMIDDLIAGIRADLGIKIYGDDIHVLDSLAQKIQKEVASVPGAADMQREQMLGLPQFNININRHVIARHGLNVEDVQDIITTALAGKTATEVIEGSRRFGLIVRFHEDYRDTPQQIGSILVATPTGGMIPLRQLANLERTRGYVCVMREDGHRRTAVMANVRGRDLGSFVAQAQERVAKNVPLPKGYRIVWAGQFENQQRAMARLCIVVPVVLVLIFVLLFSSFNSVRNAGLIMLNVPFAMIGGIVALLVSHQTLSVPAIIGFIALFGVSVQNGVIMVSYIMQMQKEGMTAFDAAWRGAHVRLRPVLMTAMVAVVALIPKVLSSGTGAEVQRPLATVVLGGLITATVLTLIVIPTIYVLLNRYKDELSQEPEISPGTSAGDTPTIAMLVPWHSGRCQ
ncbi:MAG: efflux RND transporter permease subunit [Candidatus Obscuribacter sp.]|nr:efflux RND transporter permease subunit [Candidatus Obscuribacter sp.]